MVDITGNTNTQTVTGVPINPDSNNPIEVSQTSTLQLVDNGGVGEDGFEISANVTGVDIEQPINVAIVLDQSGSTRNNSGTDFDGDGTNENFLQAQIFAAKELFEAYQSAGYDPSDVEITLISYTNDATIRGTYNLDEFDDFEDDLDDIATEGPQSTTNFVAGLNAVDDAWDANDVEADETNVVVFLSDGFPVPGGQNIAGAAQTLETNYGAIIEGIGVGENSSTTALDQLDNTGAGAIQVETGQELVDAIVAPLTDADFERFEIVIEGVDMNGDPMTQTIVIPEGDPAITTTQLGWSFDCIEIDPNFDAGQDITVTVNAIFAEDPGDPGSGEQVVTTVHNNIPLVFCFTPGALIVTPDGEIPVENLVIGDRVVTRDRGIQTIRWVGQSHVSQTKLRASKSLRPIRIGAGALDRELPQRDLVVSRQHRILIRGWRAEMMFGEPDGVLVPAVALVNDQSICEEPISQDVTYIHIAFDNHEVIYADGLETESFQPAQRTMTALADAQRDELMAVFPELATEKTVGSARLQPKTREARALI